MINTALARHISVLFIAVIVLGCVHEPKPVNSNLFLDDEPSPVLTQELGATPAWIESIRIAKLNEEQFFERGFEPGTGIVTRFNLFDDAEIDVSALTYQAVGTGSTIWRGSDRSGEPMRIALAVTGRSILGEIHTLDGTYQIVPIRDGWHRIERHEPNGFPPEADPIELPAADQAPTDVAALTVCDAPPSPGDPVPPPGKYPRVHLMIAYTPAAAGDVGDVNIHADLLLDQLQSIWRSSPNFIVEPVLAHVARLSQNSTGNPRDDIRRLRDPSDALWDEVHALRDQYKADLVAVIARNMSGACGIGYRPTPPSSGNASYGFSITKASCALTNLSFAHELGHNMSMHHDRYVLPPQPAGRHDYGFSNERLLARTIMAYADYCGSLGLSCRRMPIYSNLDIYSKNERMGVPIGQPNAAHNRDVLCRAAVPVSNYRR